MSVASPSPGLQLQDLRIALPGRVLVDGLSIQVAPGEVVTVMGPSGSGKSSLLDAIAGFLQAPWVASGQVMLAGRRVDNLPPHARRTGLLFQDALLFPHLSVAGNLLFGVPPGRPKADRRQAVDHALAEAGLAGYGNRDPATLSGGQRARVALLRTLLAEPQALLLDEPFGKLDTALRDDFRRFVFEHVRRLALPTLMVTHDRADADAAGGPVIVLGQGAAS